MLQLNHIHYAYTQTDSLTDISLTIQPGEAVAFMGPNGSGKSTFLRILSMLETVDGGSITYCGENAVR